MEKVNSIVQTPMTPINKCNQEDVDMQECEQVNQSDNRLEDVQMNNDREDERSEMAKENDKTFEDAMLYASQKGKSSVD